VCKKGDGSSAISEVTMSCPAEKGGERKELRKQSEKEGKGGGGENMPAFSSRASLHNKGRDLQVLREGGRACSREKEKLPSYYGDCFRNPWENQKNRVVLTRTKNQVKKRVFFRSKEERPR